MSYKALLYSSDDATARVITQVLSELDFQGEPYKEPFAAVKALTSSQIDAMVVDCANEQDAALLVKSARNSASNQQALFIAIVDGKSGVTSAFRLGANLVLTKPVSLDQAKNTLRMARGLLQKNAAKTVAPASASVPMQPKPTAPTPATKIVDAPVAAPEVVVPVVSVPVVATPSAPAAAASAPAMAKAPAIPAAWTPSTQVAVPSASILESEKESAPSLEPAEAGLLESLTEVEPVKASAEMPAVNAAKKEFPWQKAEPATAPETVAVSEKPAMPVVPKFAFKPPVKPAVKSEESPAVAAASASVAPASTKAFAPHAVTVGTAGQAAAPAPAKIAEPEEIVEEISAPEIEDEKPAVSEIHSEPPAFAKAQPTESGNKKWLLIAAGVVAAAAIGYVGWTKFQSAPSATPAPHIAPAAVSQPIAQPSAQPPATQTTNAMSSAAQPAANQPKGQLIASTARPTAAAPAARAPVVESVSASAQPNPDVVVVTNQPATPPPAPKPVAVEAAAAPNVMEVTSGSGNSAISSVVSGAPSASTPTLVTGPISQGVAQGMLIKRVQPVYPPQARAMHLGGPVTLNATIAKDGSVKNLKQVSGDSTLGKAAVDAVSQWKYSPYLLDGQPVDTPTQITVNFKAQ
jgi:periplasmic protein TonB